MRSGEVKSGPGEGWREYDDSTEDSTEDSIEHPSAEAIHATLIDVALAYIESDLTHPRHEDYREILHLMCETEAQYARILLQARARLDGSR